MTLTNCQSSPPAARFPDGGEPIVIAHRGASGYLPEHTLAAYAVAILQGADFIEPDLVMTKDGRLIARHDNVLDLTTDVGGRPEFAGRRTTKTVDGVAITGWFSEDFTLAEIKRLRAIERIPDTRAGNRRFDGQFEIPTLEEIIALAQASKAWAGREIGLYPETKHPSYFRALGLAMEERLVDVLHANGYRERTTRVYIQSFEIANLKKLRTLTRLPLVQLLDVHGSPYDVIAAGGSLTYADMATAEGLQAIAAYADAVGPEKYRYVLPRDAAGNLQAASGSDFVRDAHAAGLKVHPWTFRAENRFLANNFRSSADPNALGDIEGELAAFLATGIDGFFTDHPPAGVRARDAFLARR